MKCILFYRKSAASSSFSTLKNLKTASYVWRCLPLQPWRR